MAYLMNQCLEVGKRLTISLRINLAVLTSKPRASGYCANFRIIVLTVLHICAKNTCGFALLRDLNSRFEPK